VSLQARKQQFVREAIWDAAIDLFAEKGFDETTVDDIAVAAGVSRRSFFRYFASKDDLLAHAIVSYGTAIADAIEACPRHYTVAELLRATVLQVAERQATQPRARKVMEIAAKYPGAREALSRMNGVQSQVTEAFMRAARNRTGRKTTPDPLTGHLFGGLTLTVLAETFRVWFSTGCEIPVAVERVLAGLGQFTASR